MKVLKYGGRMYIIVVYDIKQVDNFAKVQRTVFKICKKYLYHIQNSVFEGNLTKYQIEKLKLELKAVLRGDDDSCIMFTSRNNRWLQKEILTNQKEENVQFI